MRNGALSVFKAKKWKYVGLTVSLISNNYYIYLKIYFEIFVSNDFQVYSEGQLLQVRSLNGSIDLVIMGISTM